MEKVLLYTANTDSELVRQALPDYEVAVYYDKHDLVRSVIKSPSALCLLMQIQKITWEYQAFLSSLKKHFPLIKLGIICPLEIDVNTDWYTILNSKKYDEDLVTDIQNFVYSAPDGNMRRYNRFDWILKGALEKAEDQWEEYEIHSLSAGGAYLKCETNPPSSGQIFPISIQFQDFSLKARCEVLPTRQSSSNLPFGFGVRFVNLSDESQDIINHIVNDALLKVLIDPEAQPEVPSLGDDNELTLDFEPG